MNGARAEVPLPGWFRRLLARLVRLRLRLGPLSIGMTEGGWILAASVAGAWAAAASSGNNLLVLAAALGTGLLAAALAESGRLLARAPARALAGVWLVEPGRAVERVLPRLGTPARIRVSLPARVQAELLDDGRGARLRLAAPPDAPRGVHRLAEIALETDSPAGVFVLALRRPVRLELVIPPRPLPPAALPPVAQAGTDFDDLRRYAPGDALARVHWRRAAGRAPEHWLVKRFAGDAAAASQALTVDLRRHGKPAEALEALLGAAWHLVRTGGVRRLRAGARAADVAGHPLPAARLLAEARAEDAPPPVVEGRLLSLGTG